MCLFTSYDFRHVTHGVDAADGVGVGGGGVAVEDHSCEWERESLLLLHCQQLGVVGTDTGVVT